MHILQMPGVFLCLYEAVKLNVGLGLGYQGVPGAAYHSAQAVQGGQAGLIWRRLIFRVSGFRVSDCRALYGRPEAVL